MELGLGWAAAVAAVASAAFVFFQVREMQHQTRLQREIAESAAQPYVWLDARIQTANGVLLELVLGNSGPTVATNIRVTVDPPFTDAPTRAKGIEAAQELMRDPGLTSLAPGREVCWSMGRSQDVVSDAASAGPRVVTIDAQGPHGPIPTARYTIHLEQIRESVAHRPGTLHEVAQSIGRVADKLKD